MRTSFLTRTMSSEQPGRSPLRLSTGHNGAGDVICSSSGSGRRRIPNCVAAGSRRAAETEQSPPDAVVARRCDTTRVSRSLDLSFRNDDPANYREANFYSEVIN